jgi:ADP-heptose:LPS heptosyltransferase
MKVLIIRFSSIGDIVLTTPVVRCIKLQLRNPEVHYITREQFGTVLAHNPHIDKLYTINKSVWEIEKELKNEKYDLLIDLHNNLRSAQIKWMLGKRSKSFHKLNFKKWLLVNVGINLLPQKHIVDRYFETVNYLGVKNDGSGLDYFIAEEECVNIQTLPPAFHQGYIGFVIGANHFTKQLPDEKIISICKKMNLPVILLGGKGDYSKAANILTGLGLPYTNRVFNACGKYSLNQSASLIKQAKKIITNDTGLMHIAAAFKKQIVSVWGNTVPEFGMYPYYGDSHVTNFQCEVQGLFCRPCSKLGYSKCPKGHFKCMNQLNEDEITRFIQA